MAVPTAPSTFRQVQIEYQVLLNKPARPAPAGVRSNFDNPPNLDVYIYLSLSLCMVFASLAFFIRMYTKMVLLRSVGYEDYFSVVSWICFTGNLVPAYLAPKSGLGKHMWDIKLKTFFRFLYLENINLILYGINVCLIKTSILLQYQRIFVIHKTRKSTMFVAIQTCIWIIFVFYLIETFFEIFQCRPREKIWNKLLSGGHCYKKTALFEITGVFNPISDFALLSLPMPALWNLQMPLKRKLMTMGVFAVGVLACVTSVIRAYYTWVLASTTDEGTRDETYSVVVSSICAAAELAIGIIVGSLPIMPKFLHHTSVKISKAVSFASKSAIKLGQESEGMINAPRANTLTSIKRFFAKYKARSDVTESRSDRHAEYHSEYLTLPEFDPSFL